MKVVCSKDIPHSYYYTCELLSSSVGSNDVTGSCREAPSGSRQVNVAGSITSAAMWERTCRKADHFSKNYGLHQFQELTINSSVSEHALQVFMRNILKLFEKYEIAASICFLLISDNHEVMQHERSCHHGHMSEQT